MPIPSSHIRVDPCSFLVIRRIGLSKGSSFKVLKDRIKVRCRCCDGAGEYAHKHVDEYRDEDVVGEDLVRSSVRRGSVRRDFGRAAVLSSSEVGRAGGEVGSVRW